MFLLIMIMICAIITTTLFIYEVKKQTFKDICGTNFHHRKQPSISNWFKSKNYSALNKYDDIND